MFQKQDITYASLMKFNELFQQSALILCNRCLCCDKNIHRNDGERVQNPLQQPPVFF